MSRSTVQSDMERWPAVNVQVMRQVHYTLRLGFDLHVLALLVFYKCVNLIDR